MDGVSRKRSRELSNSCGGARVTKRVKLLRRNPIRQCTRNKEVKLTFNGVANTAGYRKVDLYSAYLGKVNVEVYDFGTGVVALQCIVKDTKGRDISVKCIDAQVNKLDPERRQYTLQQLARINPTIINVADNVKTGTMLAQLRARSTPKQQLYPYLTKLNPVDIHFQTREYIEFLQKELEIDNIDNKGILISVHNVPRLDNAFYTGDFMVYGNGNRGFLPLGCLDVTGHELGHGLVQTTANLEYKGHSGALNESFADVYGVSFEFWMYKKYNENESKTDDLAGKSDWLLGEDIGNMIPYLRNMENPDKAQNPQPITYKGVNWANPNDMSFDEGGVHINSGITNKCFFLVSKKIGLFTALRLWHRTLTELKPLSSFIDFRNALTNNAPADQKNIISESLAAVGLTPSAVSDWNA